MAQLVTDCLVSAKIKENSLKLIYWQYLIPRSLKLIKPGKTVNVAENITELEYIYIYAGFL